MRLAAFLLIGFLLSNCASRREPVMMCGGSIVAQSIRMNYYFSEEIVSDEYVLFGTAHDVDNSEPFPFLKVKLTNQRDSTVIGALTDFDGKFSIDVPPGNYSIELAYVGVKTYSNSFVAVEGLREGIRIEVGTGL